MARFNECDEPRFIVSTAAGGEGLNLQHRCYTIVNYDLPWNPNVLQQRITRTEGVQSLILRRELASFVVPVDGDAPEQKPELIEHVAETVQGPPRVNGAEARRAFEIGRQAANDRLLALANEVRSDYPGDKAGIPAISEFALAWVRAV